MFKYLFHKDSRIKIEITEIFNNPERNLNDLIDQFRKGRNPKEIIYLLDAKEEKFIDAGLLILNEISIKKKGILKLVIARLERLLDHNSPSIRIFTLIVLGDIYSANNDAQRERSLFLKMCQDKDKVIQETAHQLLNTGKLY